MMNNSLNLKVGEWVEIRSKEEILATLDRNGQLEGMPFMPQMFQYCGKRLRVYRRAHKTCDTVYPVRGRRLSNGVHLETRCDGQAYGGCQASCLIFWKEAWMKRVDGGRAGRRGGGDGMSQQGGAEARGGCSEQDVLAGTRQPGQQNEPDPAYRCQATQLPHATTTLNWWDFRQYFEDYLSGNVGIWTILKGAVYSSYYGVCARRVRLRRIMEWFYNTFRPLWRGTLFPRSSGTLPAGIPTPSCDLSLQPGELVRVKSHREILRTLNTENKNRGLFFDAEMVPYCGGAYRVLKRVDRILDEKTGKMVRFKNQAIILEGVICQSRYSDCRMFCPRAIYSYWREIWLERISAAPAEQQKRA
jgi:hypothetical protein